MSLYIVATPIGNLNDISSRALETLSKVNLILAEDTRRIRKLLTRFEIKQKVDSFHAYSDDSKIERVLHLLNQGQKIALVTDAGTPAVSDPGSRLIDQVFQNCLEVKIIPIPGPSAVTTALSVSGFSADNFTFLGYSPKKSGRHRKFYRKISESSQTQVFFSTPHSILKDLDALQTALTSPHLPATRADKNSARTIFIGREMTKIFESYYRGTVQEVLEQIKKDPRKGEYTVVVSKMKNVS